MAAAQVASEITLQSDYRVRGVSLSRDEPAAMATVSYDDRSGIYLGGSATGAWAEGNPRLLALQVYGGYALRIGREASADAGAVQTHYSSNTSFGRAVDYTEFYAGLSLPHLSWYVFYSPDYNGSGLASVYGQVGANVQVAPQLHANAHLGHLAYIEQPKGYPISSRQDWRISLSRTFGRANAFASVSGRIERGDNRDTAFIVGLARSF